MKIETILIIVALFFFSLAVIFGLKIVFGEQYTFNYTRELQQEQKVLDICIYTSIKLDFCNTRYGGISTMYGEAIK